MLQQTQLPAQCTGTAADLYELLPKLVKQLSHLLYAMQRVLIVSQQSPLVFQVEAVAVFEQRLAQNLFSKCNYQSYNSISQQNAGGACNLFRRFCCRVMETLITFKQRAQTSSVFKILMDLIGKVQNSVLKLQQNGGFAPFIHQISANIHQFLAQLKKNLHTKKQTIPKTVQKNTNALSNNAIQQNKTQILQTEYKIKLRKSLCQLNSRFKTIDCMELDYAYFRSSFFRINGSDDFFQLYLQRNQQISNQIMAYAKNYKIYSDRKLKKKAQRNLGHLSIAFNSFSQTKGHPQTKYKSPDTKYNSVAKYVKSQTNNEVIELRKRFLTKKYSLCQQNNQKEVEYSPNKEFGKTKYQIKNVVISGNSLMAESFIQPHKNNMRNTIFKLQRQTKKGSITEKNSFLRNLKQLSNSIYDNK